MQTDPIARIWDDYRAGRISADEMTRAQTAHMPRCVCGQPGVAILAGAPICVECAAATYRADIPSGESCLRRKGGRR